MPTYEYECTECGERVEVFQRITDDPLTECPVCGGPLRKLFHPAGILFKGSGFYSTDNRRSGGSTKEPKESTKESTKESAKTEKPAEKKSDGGKKEKSA